MMEIAIGLIFWVLVFTYDKLNSILKELKYRNILEEEKIQILKNK